MASPALIEYWSNVMTLAPREKILAVARLMYGTKYEYGAKAAKPADFLTDVTGRKIDCSGFVRAVFDQVFPEQGLGSRYDLSALKFLTEDLFVNVDAPLAGDIVCWNGHVGIVYNPAKGEFIGAQSSTGVAVAKYTSGYWANTRHVKKFRRWKTL